MYVANGYMIASSFDDKFDAFLVAEPPESDFLGGKEGERTTMPIDSPRI